MLKRWTTYQAERFPLSRHLPLVLVTCLCALAGTLGIQQQSRVPPVLLWLGCGAVTLGLFFQLRVLDEHKDYEDDARYRPYRPVPRGLLGLRDLALAGWLVLTVQLLVTLLFARQALWPLLLCWGFMALMEREFFVPGWLKARPLLYMLSHAPVTGLIQINASAWVWKAGLPREVLWLAASATAAGVVLEIGRKLRAPEQEEPGVGTYTADWGPHRALGAWLLAGAVAAALTLLSSPGWLAASLLAVVGGLSVWRAGMFHRAPTGKTARWFEPVSAMWALVVFAAFAVRGAA